MTAGTRTSEFFDSYAHDFNAIYGTTNSIINRLVNKHLRRSMMLRYVRTIEGCDPVEGRSVADIGCGPGHYGIALAGRGAGRVMGIDFAGSMIELARRNAEVRGVAGKCDFICDDFMTHSFTQKYDYSILMGFMDYIDDPLQVVRKVLSITSSRAFFSFPAAGGLLAWQRKIRYRRRCDLFLYSRDQLSELFGSLPDVETRIEKIARDFFVTLMVK